MLSTALDSSDLLLSPPPTTSLPAITHNHHTNIHPLININININIHHPCMIIIYMFMLMWRCAGGAGSEEYAVDTVSANGHTKVLALWRYVR